MAGFFWGVVCYRYVMVPTDPMVEITGLRKVYGTGPDATVAVDDISLTIPRGAFFGILGPNGAGKSTTIHCMTGISQPTAGQILIDGIDVVRSYKQARAKVGLSPQEFNVDIFATPVQLMDYMGGYYGMRHAARVERIERLIDRFGLQAHRDMKFQRLSGGLKRRVMLGRALVHTPELLILDEPTAGVDVEQRHDLWRFLQEMNERGKTIILTSHYLEEIQHLCRDIAVIDRGKIVAQGRTDEFTKDGQSVEAAYLAITQRSSLDT